MADGFEYDAPELQQDRWRCRSENDMACFGGVLHYCRREGEFLVEMKRDCGAEGLRCVDEPPIGCAVCALWERRCEGQDKMACREDGSGWVYDGTCDASEGEECIDGYCKNACEEAAERQSYIGCEYYAVDLDNAVAEADASAQQFAVVISNASRIEAFVWVERNDAPYGEPPEVVLVEERRISPGDLEVIELERREVDGSTPAGQNDGTGSALTSNAYRIRSTAPIVVYQFNPLDNVDVFSNDASILIPAAACGQEYVVLGWPQTIARTGDPATNMGNDLRAYVTIVGTDYDTRVVVKLPLNERLRVLGDGGAIYEMIGGDTYEVTLGPFDVLNLESDGFLADFTGTEVISSKPVVVFSGSEASDVPAFEDLTRRFCCADHLEEQLYPADRLGRRYIAALMPARTIAVRLAGGEVTVQKEKEYFKLVGIKDGTTVTTTLPAPNNVIFLDRGESVVLEAQEDFLVEANKAVSFGQFVASQNVTGIPSRYPGGDPAFINVPPVEQWRKEYLFLLPSLYAFDFIVVIHPPSASVLLNGAPFPPTCKTSAVGGAEEEFEVTKCQMSYPQIIEEAPYLLEGEQQDGVHEVVSDQPVGLIVYGFDRYVSYGYPGGTDLRIIE